MARLTKRKENGFVTFGKRPRGSICDVRFCSKSDACPNIKNRTCLYLKMIDRLAAYEDTGLEPEDIQSLEAEWCICKQLVEEYRAIGTIDHLRKLVQAEKDGRLVVLPCKVGDTVYMQVAKWNTITGYEEDKCDGFYIGNDGILQIKAQSYTGSHGTYGVPGKTVFLTRKEAEAALEAQKGGAE